MQSDATVPDIAEFTRATVREIEHSAPVVSSDEVWASISKYNGWNKALKPYMEERIEQLKTMSEIDFSGRESVSDVGIRYMICGGIAKELQDIINKVEVTKAVLEQISAQKKADEENNK